MSAARKRFRAAGAAETEWQDNRQSMRCQLTDPDGYLVELYPY